MPLSTQVTTVRTYDIVSDCSGIIVSMSAKANENHVTIHTDLKKLQGMTVELAELVGRALINLGNFAAPRRAKILEDDE